MHKKSYRKKTKVEVKNLTPGGLLRVKPPVVVMWPAHIIHKDIWRISVPKSIDDGSNTTPPLCTSKDKDVEQSFDVSLTDCEVA
jgi:hypothetical protein